MKTRARIAIVAAVTVVYLSGEATVLVTSAFTPPFGSGSSSPSSSSHIICHSHSGSKKSIPRTTTVRVCQNKHCRKRAQQKDILQTVHNLLDLPPPSTPTLPSSTSSSSSSCGAAINIVSTGCLSECDKGPNVEVEVYGGESYDGDGDTSSSNNKILLHGMKDTQSCATQFNMLSSTAARSVPSSSSSSSDDDDDNNNNNNDGSSNISRTRNFDHLKPNKVLVAASKVIEQTLSLKRNDEKVRYLSSIIDTLDTKTSIQQSISENDNNNNINDNSDNDVDVACTTSGYIDYTASAVYAHAHALRAQTYVEMDRYDDAIQDAQRVVSTIKLSSSSTAATAAAVTQLSITLAYRSWVDSEYMKLAQEQQQEEQSPSAGLSTMMMGGGLRRSRYLSPDTDTSRIRSVLQQWSIDQPSYRLKIEDELKNFR